MPRFACNPVLTYKGGVRCNMFAGALVPRRGTDAGVPGPRRSADECDAGWFAPVATRRRSLFFPAFYSVLLNSAIAIAVMPTPITATIPSDRPSGTAQPGQVMVGDSASPNAGAWARGRKHR